LKKIIFYNSYWVSLIIHLAKYKKTQIYYYKSFLIVAIIGSSGIFVWWTVSLRITDIYNMLIYTIYKVLMVLINNNDLIEIIFNSEFCTKTEEFFGLDSTVAWKRRRYGKCRSNISKQFIEHFISSLTRWCWKN